MLQSLVEKKNSGKYRWAKKKRGRIKTVKWIGSFRKRQKQNICSTHSLLWIYTATAKSKALLSSVSWVTSCFLMGPPASIPVSLLCTHSESSWNNSDHSFPYPLRTPSWLFFAFRIKHTLLTMACSAPHDMDANYPNSCSFSPPQSAPIAIVWSVFQTFQALFCLQTFAHAINSAWHAFPYVCQS